MCPEIFVTLALVEARGRGYCPRAAPFAGAPGTPGCPSLPGDPRNEPKQTEAPPPSWTSALPPRGVHNRDHCPHSPARPSQRQRAQALSCSPRALPRRRGVCPGNPGPRVHQAVEISLLLGGLLRGAPRRCSSSKCGCPRCGCRGEIPTAGGSGQGGTQPDAEASSPSHTTVQILGLLCLLAPRAPPIQSKGGQVRKRHGPPGRGSLANPNSEPGSRAHGCTTPSPWPPGDHR